jgi:2-polyprenyl-3-methyl-5-hydroxy-6-metoxy-1,4-benzoquinol methylase
MPARARSLHVHDHDWHSPTYVEQWIGEDITRDAERRPILRKMLSFAPFEKNAKLRILDVGAGYGVVTEEALRAFPKARVTWQDYSRPMRDQAQKRLAKQEKRMAYVLGDLSSAAWQKELQGPFELVVSGIAIHNLRDRKAIFRCYGTIRGLLAPGGCFLDYDYFQYAGGLDIHLAAMREAGFATVDAVWQEGAAAIVKAA